MIHDLSKAKDLPTDSHICIVGSGPAGAILAKELLSTGLRVVVLESGLDKITSRGDALRATESKGLWIKPWSRERVLGGASTTWAGLSSPLDDADLAPRAHLGGVAWPIPAAELSELWEQAARRHRFPGASDFGPQGFARLRNKGDLQPIWQELEEKVFLAAAEPQNFGSECRGVWESKSTDLLLDATVTQLHFDENVGRVSHLSVVDRMGQGHTIRAQVFGLACGGIETARLLLASPGPDGVSLGNGHDQVGRCFMNHPKSYAGKIRFFDPVRSAPYFFGCIDGGFAGYAGLRLPTERQAEKGLMNSYVRLEPLFPWTDNPGIEALVTLVKQASGLMRLFRRSRKDELVELRDYSETGDDSETQNARRGFGGWLTLGFTVLIHLPGVLHYLAYRLTRRTAPIHGARIRAFMEMEPRAQNRVTLSDKLDPNGQCLPLVTHDVSPLDRKSILEVYGALDREIERLGLGSLEGTLTDENPWPINQDASHHMGTTRMGREPADSVTDPDLLVRDSGNVYAAGASVFPTSGCANPTYTIAALSIRLARHLEQVVAIDEENKA